MKGVIMDREKLKEFLEYCDKEFKKKVCALFDHSASIAHKGSIFRFNIMSELYIQQNELLMELIAQPCEHRKLIELLNRNIEENEKTEKIITEKRNRKERISESSGKLIFDNR